MKTVNELVELSDGNPGAATFLCKVVDQTDTIRTVIFSKIDKCPSLKGESLWMLWKYAADSNMIRVMTICLHCPTEILEEACQDRDIKSFRFLQKYCKTYNDEN